VLRRLVPFAADFPHFSDAPFGPNDNKVLRDLFVDLGGLPFTRILAGQQRVMRHQRRQPQRRQPQRRQPQTPPPAEDDSPEDLPLRPLPRPCALVSAPLPRRCPLSPPPQAGRDDEPDAA
jgi:hypothetical protein